MTFLEILTTISRQLAILLGLFFLAAFLLAHAQTRTNRNYVRLFGWRGLMLTAWIGTPVHEISHWLMAKIFRHRIDEVKLFQPNKQTGGLGHVEHSFDRRSLYQQTGRFFVGAAPLIGAAAVLLALLFAFPMTRPVAHAITSDPFSLRIVATAGQQFATTFITHWLQWIVILYLSFAISAHIAPSTQDRKNMLRGLPFAFVLAILLLMLFLLFVDKTAVMSFLSSMTNLGLISLVWLTALQLIHLMTLRIIVLIWRKSA